MKKITTLQSLREDQLKTRKTWLRIGDKVDWKGAWGQNAPLFATVKEITLVEQGEKYGEPVSKVPWEIVPTNVVVTLTNGHWAYGEQIEPAGEPLYSL